MIATKLVLLTRGRGSIPGFSGLSGEARRLHMALLLRGMFNTKPTNNASRKAEHVLSFITESTLLILSYKTSLL